MEEARTGLVVLKSLEDMKIRSNAAEIKVHVVKLREKIKDIEVKKGSVVAIALDEAGVDADVNDPKDLDVRVNGKKASLLQVLNVHDTIYVAPKVAGN